MTLTGIRRLPGVFWRVMPIQTAFMIDYKFGEVILIAFPYTNGMGSKKRPALVLYDAGYPDVLVA